MIFYIFSLNLLDKDSMGVKNNEVVIATTWDLSKIKELEIWIKTSLSSEEQSLF